MSKDVISVDSQDKLYLFQTHAGTINDLMKKILTSYGKECLKIDSETNIKMTLNFHFQMLFMSARLLAAQREEQFLQ